MQHEVQLERAERRRVQHDAHGALVGTLATGRLVAAVRLDREHAPAGQRDRPARQRERGAKLLAVAALRELGDEARRHAGRRRTLLGHAAQHELVAVAADDVQPQPVAGVQARAAAAPARLRPRARAARGRRGPRPRPRAPRPRRRRAAGSTPPAVTEIETGVDGWMSTAQLGFPEADYRRNGSSP